jgi:hypothetical protein
MGTPTDVEGRVQSSSTAATPHEAPPLTGTRSLFDLMQDDKEDEKVQSQDLSYRSAAACTHAQAVWSALKKKKRQQSR